MLKKISIRKITVSLSALFAILLIYLIPSNIPKLKPEESLEYVNINVEGQDIFLLDQNSYIALTEAPVTEKDIEKRALELIKILTIGGVDSKVPSGFSAILPPDTEILNITYDHEVLKVNFSKEILDIKKELEEKMIEALVYTLTSIKGVDKIIIYVEGDILTKLPKTKINLPSTLDRTFGINKEFDLTSTKDITDVTIYYINQINDNYYYVPVTKYLNDSRDKISIVIEELCTGLNPNKKLVSYLNEDVKLVSSTIEEDTITLELKDIKEELKDKSDKMLTLSLCDNYNIEKVNINEDRQKCRK
ncbi:MAG: GerMN domain-containing protein [Bacilli bacterium]|nr:GerMN domain-containing protein [Bacilli bacterium]MBR3209046.1 GerMN domain-containing protein [Bacilli bacterium]